MNIPTQNLPREHQSIKKDLNKAIFRVLESAEYATGIETQKFETAFATLCQTKYAVATGSGTDSLFATLKALNIGVGDEVITTPLTFIATAEAIILTGATPVFVDIDKKTWNISSLEIQKKITTKTRAIICVHLYGVCCEMEKINRIARQFNLRVVEDAAHAHGSLYHRKPAGSLGDVGCFSFYPTKVLGAIGNAGAITTNNKRYANKIRAITDHGRLKKRYKHASIGHTGTMDALQAAVLTEKLQYLPTWIQKREAIVATYRKHITTQVQEVSRGQRPSYYAFAIRVKNRNTVQSLLRNSGVQTQVYYPIPLHLQPSLSFLKYKAHDFPEAESLAKEVLSLPLYPTLTKNEQMYIIGCLRNYGLAD